MTLALALLTMVGLGAVESPGGPSFRLYSTAFVHGEAIPRPHTCQGRDVSPPLSWTGAPAGTKSFALIVDDPDAPDPAAPKLTWVHWVLFNIPASRTALPEALGQAPAPIRAGLNDWKKPQWGGPCPPVGKHRYFFKLYALDRPLELPGTPTKPELESAMRGHVLGQAELVGTYLKTK